jgi:sugar/nucleoside kinase (ribokinase family)
MFEVITFGAATFDVFLKSLGMQVGEKDGKKDICVRYGAKLEVNEIFFDYGGGGTNSAVTFSRQGLRTASVVQLGDDFFGQKIITDLQKEGVSTNLIDVQKGYTDYSTILWAPDGGRTILVYRGKTKLEKQNITWDKLQANWFYVASLEGNLEIVENLSGKIAWNPGNRELKQKEKLISLLPKITLLNINKEEMEELLGKAGEIKQLLKEAQNLPCEYIVITDDKNGAYLWEKKSSTWYHCGIFADSPRIETTGAGDSFGSGLVCGFAKEYSLEDCLYLASANASSVVGKIGAKQGILKPVDLKDWPKEKLLIEKLNF